MESMSCVRPSSRLLQAFLLGVWALASAAQAAQPRPLGGRNCPPALYALLNDSALPLSARLMIQPLSAAAAEDKRKWFQSSVAASLRRSLQQQLDWARYNTEGLAAGEKVFWIQQARLKELNEKFWDIGGTEYYLLTFDKILGDVLEENPSWGRIIHRNYKDRVIVSDLSARDFEVRVMGPVKARLGRQISRIRERPADNEVWSNYIERSISLGKGASLVDAHVNLKLQPFRLSIEEWRMRTITMRTQLENAASARGLEWGQVLRQARTLSKQDPQELDAWLAANHWPSPAGDRIRSYISLASVADFLPLNEVPGAQQLEQIRALLRRSNDEALAALAERPLVQRLAGEAWDLTRSLFLEESLGARFMAATDIEGLGARGLIAQDAWIARGARTEDLARVYESPSRFLEEVYQSIEEGLRRILGRDARIGLYRSGDDGLWSLPSMTPEQQRDVAQFLKDHGGVYSHLQTIDGAGTPAGVAKAVFESRRKLFASKHAPPTETGP